MIESETTGLTDGIRLHPVDIDIGVLKTGIASRK
jgi:hypothetical protein